MRFLDFCHDYNIEIAPEGHKHHRTGWVNISCPFCTGTFGYHLGYHSSNFTNCYRCGSHSLVNTVQSLIHTTYRKAKQIIEEYDGTLKNQITIQNKQWKENTDIKLPIGTKELDASGISYLEKRGFDVQYLIDNFDLKQTGPVGQHKFRIVIPIKYQEHTVSWTCRSYIGHKTRYLTCPRELEAIPAKEILYNIDNTNRNSVIVVEGCADVWKLGYGSVCTFGTQLTSSQLLLLHQYKRIILLSDNDQAGKNSWKKVKQILKRNGIQHVDIVLPMQYKDVGEIPFYEAQYIKKCLVGGSP